MQLGWMDTSMSYIHRREIERTRLHMGVSMIDLGTLVKWRDGSVGLVISVHTTNRGTRAYGIKWFDDGSEGVLSAWQFEVIA